MNVDVEYNEKLILKGKSFLSDFNTYAECPEGEMLDYCYNLISSPNRDKYEIVNFIKNVPYINESDLTILTIYDVNELWHTVIGAYIEYYMLKIKGKDTKEGINDLMFFHQYIDSLKDVQEGECLFEKKHNWLDEIACAFINGVVVGKNTTEGIRLLHKSIVSEGNYMCKFTPLHLAMIYHYELDGYFDKDEALKWYEEAEKEADLFEDNDMLSFVQFQMNLLKKSTIDIPDFSAVVDFVCDIDEPIKDCKYFIAIKRLSGLLKVGDRICVEVRGNKLFATIKGISLFDILVDNVIVENTYAELLVSFDKEEDEKIIDALIMADDDSVDYYKEILIYKK